MDKKDLLDSLVEGLEKTMKRAEVHSKCVAILHKVLEDSSPHGQRCKAQIQSLLDEMTAAINKHADKEDMPLSVCAAITEQLLRELNKAVMDHGLDATGQIEVLVLDKPISISKGFAVPGQHGHA